MALIRLELLKSIKTYLEDNRVHAEIVFLVALVAVSRKAAILDYKYIDSKILYGMAVIIVALGIGYFIVRKNLYLNSLNKGSDREFIWGRNPQNDQKTSTWKNSFWT